MPRKYVPPEPCLRAECHTPAACCLFRYCRGRSEATGVEDYVPGMEVVRAWRSDALRRNRETKT